MTRLRGYSYSGADASYHVGGISGDVAATPGATKVCTGATLTVTELTPGDYWVYWL